MTILQAVCLRTDVRGRLHVYESVYESPYNYVHDLLSKGEGF
jgi:hypothetical protein